MMKCWKFEYEGNEQLQRCVDTSTVVTDRQDSVGRERNEAKVFASIAPGDGVILASLARDKIEIYAVGLVISSGPLNTAPAIRWTVTRKTRYHTATDDLSDWRGKTAFEISPAMAEGVTEMILYYRREDREIAQ